MSAENIISRNYNEKKEHEQEGISPSEHFWYCDTCDDFHYDLRCDKEPIHVMDNDERFLTLKRAMLASNHYLEKWGLPPIHL